MMDIEYLETKKRQRDSLMASEQPIAQVTPWALKNGKARYGVCVDDPRLRTVGYSVDHDLRLRILKCHEGFEVTRIETKKRRL